MTAVAIRLPELGTADETVRVSCWLVDLGDDIEAGDRLVEVLIRGITFDVMASVSGRLVRIERWSNAPLATGDVLGWIEPRADEPAEQPGAGDP